jgi:hypothetical protein
MPAIATTTEKRRKSRSVVSKVAPPASDNTKT